MSDTAQLRMRRSIQTGMYDTTTTMHIIKTEKNLLCNLFAKVHGNTLVLMPFDETKQVLTEHLEHHAYMRAVGPLMTEVVEERNDMRSAGMGLGGRGWRVGIFGCGGDWGGGRCDETLQKFDFVERSFCVPRSRLDDLERDMAVHPVQQQTSGRIAQRRSHVLNSGIMHEKS